MDIELSYTMLPGQPGAVAEGATYIYTRVSINVLKYSFIFRVQTKIKRPQLRRTVLVHTHTRSSYYLWFWCRIASVKYFTNDENFRATNIIRALRYARTSARFERTQFSAVDGNIKRVSV